MAWVNPYSTLSHYGNTASSLFPKFARTIMCPDNDIPYSAPQPFHGILSCILTFPPIAGVLISSIYSRASWNSFLSWIYMPESGDSTRNAPCMILWYSRSLFYITPLLVSILSQKKQEPLDFLFHNPIYSRQKCWKRIKEVQTMISLNSN